MKSLLIKKEFKAFFRGFLRKKDGSYRSGSAAIGLIVLLLVAALSVGGSVFFLFGEIAEPMAMAGLDWVYHAIVSIAVASIGVIGGIFTAYTSIYKAKDNDTLLAMPIRSSDIVVSRMVGVWVITLFFSLIVAIPALLAFYVYGGFSLLILLCDVLLLLALSAFSVAVCSILGWAIALLASKVGGKLRSIGIIIVSLLAFSLYFFFVNRMYELVQELLLNMYNIAEDFSGTYNPMYIIGTAGAGDIVNALICLAAGALLILLTVLIIKRRFARYATTSAGAKKAAYDGSSIRTRGVFPTLLAREFKHLFSSPAYLLNCGMGVLVVPLVTVITLIRVPSEVIPQLREWVASFADENVIGLAVTMLVVFFASMCYITAPSISLEGKNFWILRSAPIQPVQVLGAKLWLHILVTLVPTVASVCVFNIALGMNALCTVLSAVTVALFVVQQALLGLHVNLIKYNFNWLTETVAVKQSASVVITMFAGMGITLAFFLPYLLVQCKGLTYQLVVLAAVIALDVYLAMRLRTKGAERYEAIEA